MKRADRAAQRERYEGLQQRRLQLRQLKEETKKNREKGVQKLAQRSGSVHQGLKAYTDTGIIAPLLTTLGLNGEEWCKTHAEDGASLRLGELLQTVSKKAPRIFDREHMPTFRRLLRFDWVRPLKDWKPEGKSQSTVLRSLLEHLLCKYPTPRFLWEAFLDQDGKFVGIVDHIAKGGSLYEKVQSGELPIQFTRKMCHEFLKTSVDYSFIGGIRRTQVKALGGDQQLFQTWMRTPVGAVIHTAKDEAFWGEVLQFFARNPMLDHSQVSPMLDYIRFRRGQAAGFSMKGRTVPSLMRDIEKWHGDLAKEKSVTKLAQVFQRSGFKQGTYQTDSVKGTLTWQIREILTAKELLAEGRDLRHCVYSYTGSIKPEGNSIWSLTWKLEGVAEVKRAVTIQVNNPIRRIVQYRGWCNSIPEAREFRLIQQWATENGLQIGTYNGW